MTATTEARKWLLANGYHVKPKGRIPEGMMAIYQAKLKKGKISGVPDTDTPGRCDTPDSLDSEDSKKQKKVKKRTSCGFCSVTASYKHKYCPGTINQGKMGIWTCWCYEKGHTL